MDQKAIEEILNQEHDQIIEQWKELLRFNSISADPDFEQVCTDCAKWLEKHMASIGLKSELLETSSRPVVYGEYLGTGSGPEIIFYGHYDVQPVDPLELWKSKPFEPEVRDGLMYARGAEDNKGQLFFFLKAVEYLIKHNKLNCTLRVVLEGEEECGSSGLSEIIPDIPDKCKGDILMVSDSQMLDSETPTIIVGLRGVIQVSFWLGGIKNDLHSGSHGGVCQNPAHEMARILASFHNPDGSIAIEGYYDDVTGLSDENLKMLKAVPFDEEKYIKDIGVPALGGEKQCTPQERFSVRPTLEVNGVASGYAGDGMKTIIPAEARANISSRLVGDQDPEKCLAMIKKHLETHKPAGLELKILQEELGGPGILLDSKSEVVNKAAKLLREMYGKDPLYAWMGGSIPIVASILKAIQGEGLLVGFGLEDDNIHAPNESFSLEQFRKGCIYSALMLQALSK